MATPSAGYESGMPERHDDRTAERAEDLLPEERAAGSDDPEAQAAAILDDSDRREATREEATDEQEHRGSAGG